MTDVTGRRLIGRADVVVGRVLTVLVVVACVAWLVLTL